MLSISKKLRDQLPFSSLSGNCSLLWWSFKKVDLFLAQRGQWNFPSLGVKYNSSTRVQYLARARDFSHLHCIQTGCVAHPASYSVDPWSYFPMSKPVGHETVHLPSSSTKVMNVGCLSTETAQPYLCLHVTSGQFPSIMELFCFIMGQGLVIQTLVLNLENKWQVK
jgi:hypothetical protein